MSDVDTRWVHDLTERFWQGFLERNPVLATLVGDERYDDRLGDDGPAGRARDADASREIAEQVSAARPGELGVEDVITLDMLGIAARNRVRAHSLGLDELRVIDHMEGPQLLPGQLSRLQRADTPERLERLLARLGDYPRYLDGCMATMREGVASGRTAAPVVIDRVIDQVARMLETAVDESPLMVVFAPERSTEQAAALRRTLEREVFPAHARFLEALRGYRAHAREADGLWAVPGGEELYAAEIVAATSLEESPASLHAFGLERLAAIDAEREAIAHGLGYAAASELRAALISDATNRADDPAQLLAVARDRVERASRRADDWFGRRPRAGCEVRAVEAFEEQDAPPAFYYPPAADGSRGGIYYVNTHRPEERPLHRVAGVAYHEAVPGHHFQMAIETELDGLPLLRRYGWLFIGGAYTEGWGLYSERLADEMGLYEDPRERFGMLELQAWRAARLVVDTGLHAFRWDRERVIAFMTDQASLTPVEAQTETDRYIADPGQALEYMVGQREIETLRRQLTERDGPRFDLKRFHDAILGHGSLPLATLRRELPRWVPPGG